MGIFDRFAKDIIEASKPSITEAERIRQTGEATGRAFGAVVTPFAKKEMKDVLTGEYSLDTDTRDLIRKLGRSANPEWLRIAEGFEQAKKTKDKKALKEFRKQRLNIIPSKTRLRELERQQLGLMELGARRRTAEKPERVESVKFLEVSKMGKRAVGDFSKKLPSLKGRPEDREAVGNVFTSINTYFSNEAVNRRNRNIDTATKFKSEIEKIIRKGTGDFTESFERLNSDLLTNIKQADISEQEKRENVLLLLANIDGLATPQGRNNVVELMARDIAQNSFTAKQGELTDDYNVIYNDYVDKIRDSLDAILRAQEGRWEKDLKKLYKGMAKTGFKGFTKPRFGKTRDFINRQIEVREQLRRLQEQGFGRGTPQPRSTPPPLAQ